MKQKRNKKGIALRILGAVLAVWIVILAVNHETVRVAFYTAYNPQNELDADGWTGGAVYENVRYADVSESDYVNIYVPEADVPPQLIVLVHGGGFVSGDAETRQTQLFYQYFRDRGYACASVNYRLAQEAPFPAAVEDVKAAVRFLRANAEKYGYDAEKIAIWGESAGGYLAVMAGVTAEDEFNDLPFIGEDELEERVSGQIAAVLDFYGAMELEPKAERRAAFKALGIHIPGFAFDIADAWVAQSLKDYPEYETVEELWLRQNIADMSAEERNYFTPMYYAQKNLTPDSDIHILILHGDADITVPRSQSQHLYDALVGAMGEGRAQIRYIHNAPHAGEKLYTDAALGEVEAYLRIALGN